MSEEENRSAPSQSSDVRAADWEFAADIRRSAALAMSPAERLEMLEEMVEFIFSAWDRNPSLRAKAAVS